MPKKNLGHDTTTGCGTTCCEPQGVVYRISPGFSPPCRPFPAAPPFPLWELPLNRNPDLVKSSRRSHERGSGQSPPPRSAGCTQTGLLTRSTGRYRTGARSRSVWPPTASRFFVPTAGSCTGTGPLEATGSAISRQCVAGPGCGRLDGKGGARGVAVRENSGERSRRTSRIATWSARAGNTTCGGLTRDRVGTGI